MTLETITLEIIILIGLVGLLYNLLIFFNMMANNQQPKIMIENIEEK